MDGSTLQAGAVAALHGFRHPISVARQVMEKLPHVLMAGEGAARFADEIGAERCNMLSPEARQGWLDHLSKLGLYDTLFQTSRSLPDVKTLLTNRVPDLIDLVHRATSRKEGSDTMNVIVRDETGNIFSAVSTSGIAWKYPGRVGDSPVIGAGNYADSRYGAAACMGWGEVTIRTSAARLAVLRLQIGDSLDQAGRIAVAEMRPLCKDGQWVRILIMDAHGNAGGFATQAGLKYKSQTVDDPAPQLREAITPLPLREG
jgi:beta-aspartyl-peptidase (threonine type)